MRCTARVERTANPTATPKTKPPTWAAHATPEFGLVKNWVRNHTPRSHLAEIVVKMGKTKKIRVRTGAFGNHTRYAPITAATAPEAPTTGMVASGWSATWVASAARPPAR